MEDIVTYFLSFNYTDGGSSRRKTAQLLLGCSSDLKEAGKPLQAVAKQSTNNQVEHPEAQIGHVELKQKSVVVFVQAGHTHTNTGWDFGCCTHGNILFTKTPYLMKLYWVEGLQTGLRITLWH